MKRYEILLLDADCTLLDFPADEAAAFEATYNENKLHLEKPYSSEMLESYHRINHSWWDKFEQGLCTKPELFLGRYKEYIDLHGFHIDPAALNESYFGNLSNQSRLYEGAEDFLSKLYNSYKIYIVTNGNASSQKPRLENSGIMNYAAGCYVSETVGVGKPDIRYFNYVFNDIGEHDKSKYLVIGDSLSSDIAGACNAGIDSIWYNPAGLTNKSDIKPTYDVSCYQEILKILE